MKTLLLAAATALSTLCGAALAAPVSFQYTGTVASSSIAAVAAGDPARITVTLDNGGVGQTSQVWTAANLTAVTFDFDNGALTTRFFSPFGGGFDVRTGQIATDATGAVTTASLHLLVVGTVVFDYTTNGPAPYGWEIGGGSLAYFDTTGMVNLTDPTSMVSPARWSVPTTAVPEPGVLALLGLGLVGLAVTRRRRT